MGRRFRGTIWLGGTSDEPVPLAGHCFNKDRCFGRILKGSAQLADGGIDPALDVHMDAIPPQARGDLVPADELALAFDHENHQLERDAFDFHRLGPVEESKTGGVKLKVSEVPTFGAQNSSLRVILHPLAKLLIWRDVLSFMKASDQLHRRSIHL